MRLNKSIEFQSDIINDFDIYDIKTMIPLFKANDVPYWPGQWEDCLKRYPKNKELCFKLYLTKMKLKSFEKLRFDDTKELLEKLKELPFYSSYKKTINEVLNEI